jgi:hypothetical protein
MVYVNIYPEWVKSELGYHQKADVTDDNNKELLPPLFGYWDCVEFCQKKFGKFNEDWCVVDYR